MKTKINFACVLTIFMFALSFSSKAQFYTFKNRLACDVVVNYEMRINSGPCGVCSSGPVIIPPFGSFSVPICAGFNGICINIVNVGGTVPGANHLGTSPCHLVSFGQNGICSPNCTPNGSGMWNVITPTPTDWLIQ